jgi:hypothetical protein
VAALDDDAGGGDVGDLDGVVLRRAIASARSWPTFLASTSNAATNSTSRTWYGPNCTCMSPGTRACGSASL